MEQIAEAGGGFSLTGELQAEAGDALEGDALEGDGLEDLVGTSQLYDSTCLFLVSELGLQPESHRTQWACF